MNLLFYIPAFLICSCNASTKDQSTTSVNKETVIDSPHTKSKTGPVFSKDELTVAYSSAIAEYIKAMYKKDRSVFDTLFINKRTDLPDIQFAAVIEKTNILLLPYGEAQKKLSYRSSMVILNVMGWVEKERSEFLIVTFFDGGRPQHNFHVYFTNRTGVNKPVPDSVQFEYAYPAKK